nr:SEC-C metal-binding domain-containing protein [uncultured Sulfuricurvum sp.]
MLFRSERLGVEEGEYIESTMVTRAVEKAQKKVENMHFEGRKHIVEYDDVANEQRKIVYKFRGELLDPAYKIADKIESIREEYVDRTIALCGIFDGMIEEEIDLDRLVLMLKEELNCTIESSLYAEKGFDYLRETTLNALKAEYDEKMSVVDEKLRSEIEREIYLKTLDTAWREHLYQMDSMKTGIRLRAYNQKDPLVEYKKESYNLFSELVETIKYDTIKTLHVIRFKVESAEEEAEAFARQMELEKKQEAFRMSLNHQEHDNDDKKIARNDDCPCGSGLKYKNCCGKSGPKKGVFAS